MLKNILPSKYWLHMALLSSSMHILLSQLISEDALSVVSSRLKDFVLAYEELYGMVLCAYS